MAEFANSAILSQVRSACRRGRPEPYVIPIDRSGRGILPHMASEPGQRDSSLRSE